MIKTIINADLKNFYEDVCDYKYDNWEGDISFEEIQRNGGYELLDFKTDVAKVLEVETGDIFWCIPDGYDDEMLIAENPEDISEVI